MRRKRDKRRDSTPKARKGGEHVEKSRRNGKIHRERKKVHDGKRVVPWKKRKEHCEKRTEKEQSTKKGKSGP